MPPMVPIGRETMDGFDFSPFPTINIEQPLFSSLILIYLQMNFSLPICEWDNIHCDDTDTVVERIYMVCLLNFQKMNDFHNPPFFSL